MPTPLPIPTTEAFRAALDVLTSEADRIAAWVLRQENAPYEVRMAALGAREQVNVIFQQQVELAASREVKVPTGTESLRESDDLPWNDDAGPLRTV